MKILRRGNEILELPTIRASIICGIQVLIKTRYHLKLAFVSLDSLLLSEFCIYILFVFSYM